MSGRKTDVIHCRDLRPGDMCVDPNGTIAWMVISVTPLKTQSLFDITWLLLWTNSNLMSSIYVETLQSQDTLPDVEDWDWQLVS